MIRIAIIARSLRRAEDLAALLSEDERFEVEPVRAMAGGAGYQQSRAADVVVALQIPPEEIPAEGPAVVLLSDEEPEGLSAAGAIRAWLPVNSSGAEVAAAIMAAAQELFVLTREQMRRWPESALPQADAELTVEKLTGRELEVLRMMADGLANKEIAGELHISDHTVKFHVSQVLAKLGVGSRTEAVRVGIRRGLVAV